MACGRSCGDCARGRTVPAPTSPTIPLRTPAARPRGPRARRAVRARGRDDPVSVRPSVENLPTIEGEREAPPEEDAPRERPPLLRSKRTVWAWALSLALVAALASAATSVGVGLVPVAASAGAPQVATLVEDPGAQTPSVFGQRTGDERAFADFYGVSAFVGTARSTRVRTAVRASTCSTPTRSDRTAPPASAGTSSTRMRCRDLPRHRAVHRRRRHAGRLHRTLPGRHERAVRVRRRERGRVQRRGLRMTGRWGRWLRRAQPPRGGSMGLGRPGRRSVSLPEARPADERVGE